MCSFVFEICTDYAEFKKEESNKILFGRKTELDDIRNAQMHMRVIPYDPLQFHLIANPTFVNFLGTFGVKRDPLNKG
jgi:hypothetical protein